MMLQEKTILLATKHHKEQVIKPLIEQHFNCKVIVPDNFDTDQFGTFCGEKSRFLPPSKMVIHKARSALEKFDCQFAIATEGSFGPHPLIPYMAHHEELMAFVDMESKIDIVVYRHTQQTNYAMAEFVRGESCGDFLQSVNFPTHAVMVRELESHNLIAKGIQSISNLNVAIGKAFSLADRIRIETDMRALCNPTRMSVIKDLTGELINRLRSHCEKCGCYGFGFREVSGYLPCISCGSATDLYQHLIERCVRCDFSVTRPRPDNLSHADAKYCHYCNP